MPIKIRQNILLFIAISCGCLVLIFPSASSNGAMLGLNVWTHKVLPSLFPFMIISSFMYYTGLSEHVTFRLYTFVNRIIHCSQQSIFIFLTSVFAGYPMAARLVSMYCADHRLSPKEAENVLIFSSVCGPVFITGSIGVNMLNDMHATKIIAASHYSSAIITGLLFVFFLSKRSHQASDCFNHSKHSSTDSYLSPLPALTKSVTSACSTQLLIGGFITIFSVFISLLDACHFFSVLTQTVQPLNSSLAVIIKPFVSGFCEMANGSAAISNTALSMELKIMLITFFISWSGLSIHCQALGLLSESPISPTHYLIAKLLHGLISVIVSFFFICLFY